MLGLAVIDSPERNEHVCSRFTVGAMAVRGFACLLQIFVSPVPFRLTPTSQLVFNKLASL